jgi:hypothetical protein
MDIFLVSVDFVEFYDIGVVHGLKDHQFFQKFLEFLLDLGLSDGFYGHFHFGLFVGRQSHKAVGPCTYYFLF